MAARPDAGGTMPQHAQHEPSIVTQVGIQTIGGLTYDSIVLGMHVLSDNSEVTLRDGRVVTITSTDGPNPLLAGKLYQTDSSPVEHFFVPDLYPNLQLLVDRQRVDNDVAYALSSGHELRTWTMNPDSGVTITEDGVKILPLPQGNRGGWTNLDTLGLDPFGAPSQPIGSGVIPQTMQQYVPASGLDAILPSIQQYGPNTFRAYPSISDASTLIDPSRTIGAGNPFGLGLVTDTALGGLFPSHHISGGVPSYQGQGSTTIGDATPSSDAHMITQKCEHPMCDHVHDMHHFWDHQDVLLDDIALIPNDALKGPSSAKSKKPEGEPPEAPRKNFFDARYLPIPPGSVSLTAEEITRFLSTKDSKLDRFVAAYDEDAEGVPDDWQLIKEHLIYNIQKLLHVCERDPRDQPFDRGKDLEGKYLAITDPNVLQCHLAWQQNGLRALLRGLFEQSKKYRFGRALALIEALIEAHQKNEIIVPRIDEEVDIRPMRASKRLYQIMQVLQACALARADLMNGNIDELLAAPFLYLARKSNNFHTNGAKRLKTSGKGNGDYTNYRETAERAPSRMGSQSLTTYQQLKATYLSEQGNGNQPQTIEAELPNPFFHPRTYQPVPRSQDRRHDHDEDQDDDHEEDHDDDHEEDNNDDHEQAKDRETRKRDRGPDEDDDDDDGEYRPAKKSRKEAPRKTSTAAGKTRRQNTKPSTKTGKPQAQPQHRRYNNGVPSNMMHRGSFPAAQLSVAHPAASRCPPAVSTHVHDSAHRARQFQAGSYQGLQGNHYSIPNQSYGPVSAGPAGLVLQGNVYNVPDQSYGPMPAGLAGPGLQGIPYGILPQSYGSVSAGPADPYDIFGPFAPFPEPLDVADPQVPGQPGLPQDVDFSVDPSFGQLQYGGPSNGYPSVSYGF
ncbi:hypothetical protein AMS68_004651 [Peltaster fructicola]|uniref:Uncharacterized protein n=1 Tax=Peltaster fructicola TaxID=286661 RepID=A0A6H0XWN0_9PEZI|nr:hypothetical protein AMS68_004651 [Peltaster fructicola]